MNKLLLEEKGFSLAEVMITVGLVGVLGLGAAKFKGMFSSEIKRIEIKTETVVGVGLAKKIMVEDFLASGPSFSFIDRKALKTPCGNSELVGGSDTTQFWAKNSSRDCYGSEIEMNKGGDSFSFIVTERRKPDLVFFLPERAYEYSNQLGAALSFNQDKFIDFLKSNEAKIWKENSFYKLTANSKVKMEDYSDDPIKYSLLFTSFKNRITDYFDDNIIQVLYENCEGKSNYDGLDLFFRCMPLDGSDFRIKVQRVRYISYRLEKMQTAGNKKYKGFTLYKDLHKIVNNNVVIKSTNLASYIKKVFIRRRDSSSNLVSFDIEFYNKREKEEEL